MTVSQRIHVMYAHASAQSSVINRRMVEAIRDIGHVRLHDLYETYPDFDIDVSREQESLQQAELIVFQHPIQWYGMPALLKEWVDVVLESGWAHGQGGNALQGKDFWLVATTGGAEESYRPGGYHGHAFSAFLPPFQQIAQLCGMRWRAPYILHGAHRADESAIAAHVAGYRERLLSYPDWCPAVTEGTVARPDGADW